MEWDEGGIMGRMGLERKGWDRGRMTLHIFLSGNKKVGRKNPVLGRGVSSIAYLSVA